MDMTSRPLSIDNFSESCILAIANFVGRKERKLKLLINI